MLLLFLIWIALALVTGMIASSKGRSGFGWFLLGLLLPIIFLPIAALSRPIQASVDRKAIARGEMKTCPHCAELIRREAKVCRYCGRDVEGSPPPPETF